MIAKPVTLASLALASLVLAVVAQTGCEDSSSSSPYAFDGGSTTLSDGSFPIPSLPADGGVGDAADASTPTLRPDATSVRFANLSASAHDFCLKESDVAVFPELPVYAAQGGIPPMSVSYWYPAELLSERFVIRVVAAGAPCESPAFYEQRAPMQNLAKYRTFYKLDTGSPVAGGFFDTASPTPTKDTVVRREVFGSATVTFVPDSDAGPPVLFPNDGFALLEPGKPGVVTVNYNYPPQPSPRTFLPVAGGLATLYTASSTVLVCDELAPPVGHLTDCRTSVRGL